MKALVQRVSRAAVRVGGESIGAIGAGLCVLVGVGHEDGEADVAALADRLVDLRIFEDAAGKMNLSLADSGGAMLLISQFTLMADTRRGRRPSFADAAPPAVAEPLIARLVERVRGRSVAVETGVFGAHMQIDLTNEGPVTILLDTKEKRSA